jgi:hypothetical protein
MPSVINSPEYIPRNVPASIFSPAKTPMYMVNELLKEIQLSPTPAFLFCLHNVNSRLPSLLYHLGMFQYIRSKHKSLDTHPVPALVCALTEVIALHNCLIPVLQNPLLIIAEAKSRLHTIWPQVLLPSQANTSSGCGITLPNTITSNQLVVVRRRDILMIPQFVGIIKFPRWSGFIINFIDDSNWGCFWLILGCVLSNHSLKHPPEHLRLPDGVRQVV